MKRQAKPTPQDKKAAFDAQKPTRAKLAKTNSVTLGAVLRRLTQDTHRDETARLWFPAMALVDLPFAIRRAWSFESEHGSKVGFQIAFLSEEALEIAAKRCDKNHPASSLDVSEMSDAEFLFSLPWSKDREKLVKALKAELRTAAEISPCTIEAIDTGQANPFYAITVYRA